MAGAPQGELPEWASPVSLSCMMRIIPAPSIVVRTKAAAGVNTRPPGAEPGRDAVPCALFVVGEKPTQVPNNGRGKICVVTFTALPTEAVQNDFKGPLMASPNTCKMTLDRNPT